MIACNVFCMSFVIVPQKYTYWTELQVQELTVLGFFQKLKNEIYINKNKFYQKQAFEQIPSLAYPLRYISYAILSVSYINANIYCKLRNIPNSDVRNYSIDLR